MRVTLAFFRVVDTTNERRYKASGHFGTFLTIEIVVFDVDERYVFRNDDRRHCAVLFSFENERKELVDCVHVDVAAIVARYEHLGRTGEAVRSKRVTWIEGPRKDPR